jgi:aminomethyltransferase
VAAQRHTDVAGDAAAAVVQRVPTVDVAKVAIGPAVYAPRVDHDGILLNDPVLFHWHDGSWRFSIADSDVRLWLKAIIRSHEYAARVVELDTATLAVQGPRADDVLDKMGLGWVTDLDPLETRPSSVHLNDGTDVDIVLSRSGWSSQGGAELFLDDPTRADALWDTVAAAGEAFDIGPGAPNATERIEHVLLSYGTDTGYHADPIELGLTDHVDLDGPDFIGRDALLRIRDDGPARRLRGVVIDGDDMDVLERPVPFEVGGEQVGALRAGTHSPRFARNIGLVLVDGACELGVVGTVELPDGERGAELVDLPFSESLDE